jgi:hypothetical protein
MQSNDVRSTGAIRHGAYLCLDVPTGALATVADAAVPALADRLGLRNEFEPGNGDPPQAIAYLRRISATPRDIEHVDLLRATAVVHVAAATPEPVAEFCAQMRRLLGPDVRPLTLAGVVRPRTYTGDAMYNFAYAHRVLQQPGPVLPNAFLVPMRKSDEWWRKGWMERHTYFLPRYDESGRVVHEGHTLAAAAGIPCLMRRTFKNPVEPAPDGEYDFISYFECADEDVPTFHRVCEALRDVTRNPEWAFVREGPTWHGRRVATWAELFGIS